MNRTVTSILLGDPPPCLAQRRQEAEQRANGGPQIKTSQPKFRPHMKNREGKWG